MRNPIFTLLVCLLTNVAQAAVEAPATSPQNDDLDVRIARLIEQLGDAEYAARERAQRELARLGLEAFESLAAAKDSDDTEIATQARYLVRQIRIEWVRPTDPAEIGAILKDYEGQGPADRLARINQIATLTERPNLALAALEWLCRLARFEESQLLSKEAALKAIGQSVPSDGKKLDEHFATIARAVTRSRRPAALWLKAYVLEHTAPPAAAVEWEKLIAAEEQAIDKLSETSPQIITKLLRRQVGLLDKLNRPDDSLKVIARLVQMERGEIQSLLNLVDWLRERKAWTILDDVAGRFASAFASEPILLYTLAQARLEAGDSKLADDTAAKAFALRPDQIQEHQVLARFLLSRGLKSWAEREFRMVIDKLPLASDANLVARTLLSEDLHDQQREAEAAELLNPLAEAIDQEKQELLRVIAERERTPGSIKSRMFYFRACDAQMKGQIKQQSELLDLGIDADPTDADVLIALFHLPNQDEARRQRTRELIEKAVAESRQIIDETPDNEVAYNQLAWLIANTEGDFDEALQCSLKSLEIHRAASYLDTLAHCYFAKRDYQNAVKTQEAAAQLDPHIGAISRQLKVFRAALAQQQADGEQADGEQADGGKP